MRFSRIACLALSALAGALSMQASTPINITDQSYTFYPTIIGGGGVSFPSTVGINGNPNQYAVQIEGLVPPGFGGTGELFTVPEFITTWNSQPHSSSVLLVGTNTLQLQAYLLNQAIAVTQWPDQQALDTALRIKPYLMQCSDSPHRIPY